MMRLLFLSPLIVAFIVCGYLLKVYMDNSTKAPENAHSVIKMAMDGSGFSHYETSNYRKLEKFSLTVRQGVSQVREQMEFIEDQHRKLMDQVSLQKQKLEDQKRGAQAIKDVIARNSSLGLDVDLLRIDSLLNVLDHQDQVLEENNARLATLNNRTQERMIEMNNQMRMTNKDKNHNEEYIRDRMEMLRNQSANLVRVHGEFTHSADRYINLAHDQIKGVSQQLVDTNNYLATLRGPSNVDLKERVKELLVREEEMMYKIRGHQELMNQQQQENKQRMASLTEKINDLMEQNSIKVDDARIKAEDQKRQNKERVADQMQRIRQQQLDRKH